MNKLKSIQLSNIRRFSENSKIEFSSGATILLAPNGTGKTAVFEAIEFGLTGKISRLGYDLSPIIRETQNTARVSLDFGEVQATAQVARSGDIKRTGDLSPLFPETDPNDVPFLLRLTHLLDQREREWLVQADSKLAGSQLARLPIGKDGSQATSVLGSIRRTINNQVKQANAAVESLEAELGEWQSLTLDRDLASAQSQGALRSRENISESISDIARRAQCLEQLPANLLAQPLQDDGLEIASNVLEQLVRGKLKQLRDQVTALVDIDGLIARFSSEKLRAKQITNDLTTSAAELAEKTQNRALAISTHELLQQELTTAENKRIGIAQQLNKLMNKAKAEDAVDQSKVKMKNLGIDLNNAEKKVTTLLSEHERNEELRAQHNLINIQRKALLELNAELQTAEKLVELWEQKIHHQTELTVSINDKKLQEGILLEQRRVALSSHATIEAEEQISKSSYRALASTADSIRQAVSSIAAHLPNDRGDCPLCGEEHGAVVLHERVAKALEAIDPNVVEAERHVKRTSDTVQKSLESVTINQTELLVCQSEIVELESQHAELTTQTDDFRTNKLLGGETVTLAKEATQQRVEANNLNMQLLDERQQKFAPAIAPELFNQTKGFYDAALLTLSNVRQNHAEANSRLEQAISALAAINADTPSTQTLEELSIEQNQNANHIIELNAKVLVEKTALEKQQAQLTEITNKVSSKETELSETQSRLATFRATWRQLSIHGDPEAEVASSHVAQLHTSINELAQHPETIEIIKIEISAWKKLEQARTAQTVLDRRRGEFSEAEFIEKLNQRVKKTQSEFGDLSLLSRALDSLNNYLATEIENVHKHVLAVVPRWQALLKQVVRDQRFSRINLKFRTLYGKEHAEASLTLHGKPTHAPSIASEAQLTDLQLTFLLSMAMDHKWSSWPALLLDDPTQHHDMVHAASVFDVLRDYIVDHGFQVVIATHDALQARYFMRKLQNDGIEARIWTLVPTPDGVKAEENLRPSK